MGSPLKEGDPMESIIETDRKRRAYFSEQKERLREYSKLLRDQQTRINEARKIIPPNQWEREQSEFEEKMHQEPIFYEIYELLLEREIGFIINRAHTLEKYTAAIALDDLEFLDSFADREDSDTAAQLTVYFTTLLRHTDQRIRERAKTFLNIQ